MKNNLPVENPKLALLSGNLSPLLREGLIVAFSGGVDSSFLLWKAERTLCEMRDRGELGKLLALTTVSASIPPWEVEEAAVFAKSLQVEHAVIESHEVEQEAYAQNDGTRCYYCKSELFRISEEELKRRGYRHIAYGYNASDRSDLRHGHKAALENNIHAPLNDVGLEKNEIRQCLSEIGLKLADKPASPCLASRVMTGVRVTPAKLFDIQKMEEILRAAIIKTYRVRLHEEKNSDSKDTVSYFRIEVAPDEIPAVFQVREKLLIEARRRGYRWVTLDLAGYQMGGANL